MNWIRFYNSLTIFYCFCLFWCNGTLDNTFFILFIIAFSISFSVACSDKPINSKIYGSFITSLANSWLIEESCSVKFVNFLLLSAWRSYNCKSIWWSRTVLLHPFSKFFSAYQKRFSISETLSIRIQLCVHGNFATTGGKIEKSQYS